MKTSYIVSALALVIVISYLSITSPQTTQNQKYIGIFKNWKNDYQIKYSSQKQQIYRFSIFIENYKKIQLHNQNTLKTYDQGLNQFAALTSEEFMSMLNAKTNRYLTFQFQDQQKVDVKDNPDIDWISKGGVTPVKNMGQCSSSSIFSVVASLQTYAFNQKKSLIPLSEQQLIDCCSDGRNPCSGGFVNFQSLYQCVKKINITSAENYPYKGNQQKCDMAKIQNKSYPVKDKMLFTSKGCPVISDNLQKGAISVIVDASNFQFYRSGIFSNCGTSINHAVTLVGQSSSFWTIKNEWGSSWGEKGFIRLAKGNTCGVCQYGAMPI